MQESVLKCRGEDGESMKNPTTTVGMAVKIFLYSLLAAVLCFFLHMSITMALSIGSTQVLGQRVGGVLEDGRTIVVETYNATADTEGYTKAYILTDDGTEIPVATEELDQYPITQSYKENIRTAVDPAMKAISDGVAQILMAILFLAFPYSTLWYMGDRDRNQVQFGHLVENRLRGVQVGALASVPAVVMWVLLAVGKVGGTMNGFVKWYRWFNMCFLPYFDSIVPGGVVDPAAVSWGGVAAMLPVLAALPIVTGLGYLLGYKDFSVRERLVYSATGRKPKRRRK